MIAAQRQSSVLDYVKPAAGLAAAVSLVMVVFGSGVAAIEHVTTLAHSGSVVLTGTFEPGSQGDYRAAASSRIAPQRSVTR